MAGSTPVCSPCAGASAEGGFEPKVIKPPQKDTSTIRVGVIGAGANTRLRHIPGLLAIQGVSVVAVANRSLGSARAVAEQFHIPGITDDWRDILADPTIDAVCIGTWPVMHKTLTVAALQAGKHVLCEARMAMDAWEAKEMLDVARQHPNLVAQIVPSPMTLAYDATIQDIVKSGKLGRLTYISVRGVGQGFPDPPGALLHWRHSRERSGQNVLMMGILYEALERWVGGATRMVAMAQTVVKQRTDHETGVLVTTDVPDHVDVLATMACGAQAHMVFSAATGAAREPTTEFWLHGTEGTVHLDVDGQRLYLALRDGDEGGKLQEVQVPHEVRGHWRVEEEFIGAIRGQEPVRLTDFVTASRYMQFTTAVTQSCQSGQAVALPLAGL